MSEENFDEWIEKAFKEEEINLVDLLENNNQIGIENVRETLYEKCFAGRKDSSDQAQNVLKETIRFNRSFTNYINSYKNLLHIL